MAKNELQEKDFIQDSLMKNPLPAWIWLVVITCLVAVLWGGSSWYSKFMSTEAAQNPFLQVTNREFSLFLWQFPEYMRVNSSSKTSYLPGFQYENKVSLIPAEADKYVVAPPEVLFLYHTWNRLVHSEFVYRSISAQDFKEFLEYAEEWLPQNWPGAPNGYTSFIKTLPQANPSLDLNTLTEAELPLVVRQAFLGWKNYVKEGDAINAVRPALQEIDQFLTKCPHYARNYWRNIVASSYPDYLMNTLLNAPKDKILGNDEVAPFLRVALYNFIQAKKENEKTTNNPVEPS